MKKMTILILVVLLFTTWIPKAQAIQPTQNNSIQPCAIGGNQAVAYDDYSNVVWPSLAKAQAYYGYDFSYYECYHYYQGNIYNYYYPFSDGSKLYIRVACYTDDIIYSTPGSPNETK